MKFDEVLKDTVGEFGRWQKFLAFVLGLYGLAGCLTTIDTVFTAVRPDSWCLVPRPTNSVAAQLSPQQWRNLTIPYQNQQGVWRLDSCHMYSHNWTQLLLNLTFSERTDTTSAYNSTTPPAKNESDIARLYPLLRNQVPSQNTSLEECVEYEYDHSIFESTIVTEWDLVCSLSYMASVARSVSMAGMMIGAGTGGFIADRFGRRYTIIIFVPLSVLAKLLMTFSPSLVFYNIFNFLTQLTTGISYIVIFTLAMELVGPPQRAFVGTWLSETYAIGYLVLAFLGYFIRSWKLLNGAITAVMAPLLVLIFIVPESPRWLLTRGDVAKARLILRRLAHLNGRDFPDDIIIQSEKEDVVGKDRMWQMCCSVWLSIRSFLICLAWFTAAFTYYGLTFNMESLAGGIYLNMVIAGILEFIAYFVGQFLINLRIGRKITTSGLYVLAGLSLLVTLAVPKDQAIAMTVLTNFGRFCVCCLYNCIYIWTVELYPTSLRNSGLSTNSCLGKIGAVLAPFIAQLAQVHSALPIVAIGGLALVCGLLLLLLPETRGKPLPQTMADIRGSKGPFHKPRKPATVALVMGTD